ncbi:MAG: hypothetical protein K2X93_08090 [Candidatus Obscuribacterales bacterium]|nr:hypothetical protein [Candidatus Obscuribacterales bacterium]
MRKLAHLLYNPHAGSAVSPEWWIGKIVHRLCSADYEVSTVATSRDLNSDGIIKLLTKRGESDLLVATGGDGTLRIALEAVAKAKLDIPVGIIPAGTGNQLARNLGLYDDNFLSDPLEKAVDTLVDGKKFCMDMGIMNGHYFAVGAGIGPMSDAILTPEHHDKVNWKMLAYAGSLVQTIAQAPVFIKITTEGESFTVAASGIFVLNIADFGIGLLSESARIDDGILDLCVLAPQEFHDYLEMGFRFAGGMGGEQAPYYVKKVKSVDMEIVPISRHTSIVQKTWRRLKNSFGFYEKPPLVLHQQVKAMIDGDACGTTPIHIEIAPQAVSVMVPRDFPG